MKHILAMSSKECWISLNMYMSKLCHQQTPSECSTFLSCHKIGDHNMLNAPFDLSLTYFLTQGKCAMSSRGTDCIEVFSLGEIWLLTGNFVKAFNKAVP